MDLTTNIQKLKEEIFYLSEGFGSINTAINYAKEKKTNLEYFIPDHMWEDIEQEILEDISNF